MEDRRGRAGLQTPDVVGEVDAREDGRPETAGDAPAQPATPRTRGRARQKANPRARKEASLGPRGRQKALAGAPARGKVKTRAGVERTKAATRGIGRGRGGATRSKPTKGSPKAARRKRNRGTR